MARQKPAPPKVKVVYPGTLTQADADEMRKILKAWTRKACKSKESAKAALVEIGMLTPSGRLAKRYRQ